MVVCLNPRQWAQKISSLKVHLLALSIDFNCISHSWTKRAGLVVIAWPLVTVQRRSLALDVIERPLTYDLWLLPSWWFWSGVHTGLMMTPESVPIKWVKTVRCSWLRWKLPKTVCLLQKNNNIKIAERKEYGGTSLTNLSDSKTFIGVAELFQ